MTPDINWVTGNVTFRWTYNNSVNGVPAVNFNLSIALNTTGDVVWIDNIPVVSSLNDVFYNVSLESLKGEEDRVYKVSVQVRNMQGYSEPVTNFFKVYNGMNTGVYMYTYVQ